MSVRQPDELFLTGPERQLVDLAVNVDRHVVVDGRVPNQQIEAIFAVDADDRSSRAANPPPTIRRFGGYVLSSKKKASADS